MTSDCFHCGLSAPKAEELRYDGHVFCCLGCKTVYCLFSENGLADYYNLQKNPGATPTIGEGKYDFLSNASIAEKLLDFHEGDLSVATLHLPHIHCTSCIWLLENLHRLESGILACQVNFPSRKARITFNTDVTDLKKIVALLCAIGYEPNISLDDYGRKQSKTDRSLTLKLGVAFFCFGNIMLLSFPEYLEVGEYWLEKYKGFFRLLILLLSLPSFFYAASGYYNAAWKSIRTGFLSIEIPIALGIVVMFVRSVIDMALAHGPGFFDSMAGLIFFMLLGKTFQSKTYQFLNFERDYKSYFPVAVTQILPDGTEKNLPIHEIVPRQRLLVRNQELIPCDGILISAHADIDYSFVTGEALPVAKKSGDKIFAGGKQIGPGIEMETLKSVSQSYLTELWAHEIFDKRHDETLHSLTNRLNRYFTPLLLLIAVAGFSYWIFFSALTAFNVFTAVLIIACPCALALTAPFTLGNIMRIMGRHSLYLKNTDAVEKMAAADTIIFDKTGTLTSVRTSSIRFEGTALNSCESAALKSVLRASNHPLSRMLYDFLPGATAQKPDRFRECAGKGVEACVDSMEFRIGSAGFVGATSVEGNLSTSIYISVNRSLRGRFIIANEYRPGIAELLTKLQPHYKLCVLSGDNAGEASALREMLPRNAEIRFGQKPKDKLNFVKELQQQGRNVIMVGDGLNDAGALAQSDMGIAIAENVNIFSPACDAIMAAGILRDLDRYLRLSKSATRIIKASFGLSLLYNFVGLSWALSGNLSPLFAAIIMPLSTVTIVSFVTMAGNISAYRAGVARKKQDFRPKKPDVTNVIFSQNPAI